MNHFGISVSWLFPNCRSAGGLSKPIGPGPCAKSFSRGDRNFQMNIREGSSVDKGSANWSQHLRRYGVGLFRESFSSSSSSSSSSSNSGERRHGVLEYWSSGERVCFRSDRRPRSWESESVASAPPTRYAGAIRTWRNTPTIQYSITPRGLIRGRGRRRGRVRRAMYRRSLGVNVCRARDRGEYV